MTAFLRPTFGLKGAEMKAAREKWLEKAAVFLRGFENQLKQSGILHCHRFHRHRLLWEEDLNRGVETHSDCQLVSFWNSRPRSKGTAIL